MPTPDVAELERLLGYTFSKKTILLEAGTHSSLINEPPGAGRQANQRLAHLGDAVVELAVRDALFHRFPQATKGQLTDMKNDIVSDVGLSKVPLARQLAALLERGGSRPPAQDNGTIIAEAFEAAIGAVYVDSDYLTAAMIVTQHVSFPR